MARAPLESPIVRRSQYLAELLKRGSEVPQIQGGYGELAARLLAQGLTQRASEKTDAAMAAEQANADLSRRQRIAAGIGANIEGEPVEVGNGRLGNPFSGLVDAIRGRPTQPQPAPAAQAAPPPAPAMPMNTQQPVSSPVAPVAPVQGAPLPGGGQPAMPAPAPQMQQAPQAPAMSAPQQAEGGLNILPQEREYIQRLLSSGDPADEERAVALIQQIEKRSFSPNIQVGPDGTPYNASDPASMNRTFADRQIANGFVVDLNNAENEGLYLPDLQPGEEPVYDQNGRIVGVRNMDGAIEALGARERATADAANASRASYAGVTAGAEAAARAPYQFVNVQGPNGEPMTMSAALAAGQVFAGRSPEAGILAEGAARSEVDRNADLRTRYDVARRTQPALDNMERLLPDVIAGFGSDARLQAARALAATGNADARRQVAATETFQNEARQVVASILRTFGANPTEGERNYAERMSGADVSLTPETLAEGIRLARGRNERAMQDYEATQRSSGPRVGMVEDGYEFLGGDPSSPSSWRRVR